MTNQSKIKRKVKVKLIADEDCNLYNIEKQTDE